jgi:hypothetical protein
MQKYDMEAPKQFVGGISGAGAQNTVVRTPDHPPMVQDAALGLDARLQDLQSVINTLEQRLSVALRPQGPADVAQGQGATHPVPLVHIINTASCKLSEQIVRLHDFVDRLEI